MGRILKKTFQCFYRKQRADAIALGDRKNGRIVGITRQDVPYYSSDDHGRLRYRRYYFLEVEMTDPDIFDYPREFEEVHLGSGRVTQIIFVVILILMILNVFLQR